VGFISFFLKKKDTFFPTMRRICLEVVIDTFKPFEFIAFYSCVDKPTIWGKLSQK
jgi:hypothetical protein